ncbi:very short patch repair endonuclease [Secundilactobacillus collinoides]|nr:very short patch repair endonuclease [Secundilactobacillus collinoides]
MKHPKSYDSDNSTRQRMSNVHLKGGKGEQILAKALWQNGYRYRKNDKSLPGSPDIAVLKYHLAIFVDGEFWHGYDWENRKKRLKRNRDYWIKKIEENMARDQRDDALLIEKGWQPIHFWEKKVLKNTDYCVSLVDYYVRSENR